MSHFREEPRAHAPSARHQNQNFFRQGPVTHNTRGANSRNTQTAPQSTQRDTNTSRPIELPLQRNNQSPHNGRHNDGGLHRRVRQLQGIKDRLQREHDNLRREHDSLRREYDGLRIEHYSYRREHDKLSRSHDNLQCSYDQIKHENSKLNSIHKGQDRVWLKRLKNYIAPYLESKEPGSNEVPDDSLDDAMLSLRQDALQVQALRTQAQISKDRMQDLQLEMLSRVEKVPTTPDEQLAQEFRTIKALIRSLSRSIRIAPDVDVLAVLHSDDLLFGISEHEWNTRAGRKRVVEACIWSVLAEQLFDHPFSILGSLGNLTGQAWRSMFGEMHCGLWPVPAAQCERWRYTTMDSAIKASGFLEDSHFNAKETPQHPTMQSHMDQSIAQVPVHVSEVIRSHLLLFAPTDHFANVDTIVDKAVSLARKMALQRCRLQVTFPLSGEVYNPDHMGTLSDPDGGDVEEGTVAYTVNPGLTKWGDAHGEKLDQRLDIVPALVQLEPTEGTMGVKLEHQN